MMIQKCKICSLYIYAVHYPNGQAHRCRKFAVYPSAIKLSDACRDILLIYPDQVCYKKPLTRKYRVAKWIIKVALMWCETCKDTFR